MDRALLIKYLRYLFQSTDSLSRKERVEDFELGSLERELSDFKRLAQAASALGEPISTAIQKLELGLSESGLGGGKLAGVKFAFSTLFLRGWVRQELEERRQAKAKQALEGLKSDVRAVLFTLDHEK